MTEVQKELDRWHNFANGAIGNKYALMALFIATVAPEFKEEVQCNIEEELEKSPLEDLCQPLM